MTEPRCVVIRHGETEWSRSGRHTGRTDLALLPEGEEQARTLGPSLTGYRFTTVLTSPLIRARETCRLAGLGTEAVVVPDLAEWDYGSYEGLTTPEIRQDRPGWNLFDDGAPGGECAADVGRRVDRVIELVRAAPGDVACVAHGHVLRVMAARWVELEPTAARYFTLGPAARGELDWEREQPVISAWNIHPGPA
jgi:broad specificity phosphatase PhoE